MKTASYGVYHLFKTATGIKVLSLNETDYPWITTNNGEILIRSAYPHISVEDLSFGRFQVDFIDYYYSKGQELDLEVANDVWERYYLPQGLPSEQHPRSKIIPVHHAASRDQKHLALAV